MADSIKIGSLDISAFKVGSDDCKVYLGDTLLYPQGEPPTPPAFEGKYKLTLSDSSVVSAECDSTSAITKAEISAYTSTLTTVEIGGCVTSIGNYAFEYCTSLTSIDIPSGVTSIDVGAFRDCKGLTSCTIGSGVTSIGGSAFRNCTSLTSITVNATTPPTIGGGNAFGNTNNSPIYVPAESVETYKAASRWSTYASRIQAIPNS